MSAFDDLIPANQRPQAMLAGKRDAAPPAPTPWWQTALQGVDAVERQVLPGMGLAEDLGGAIAKRINPPPQAQPQPQRRGAFDDLVPRQGAQPVPAPTMQEQLFGMPGVRMMAEGVPVLGGAADYADAATNAAMRGGFGSGFGDRFQEELTAQHAQDAASQIAHPHIAAAQQLAGGALGAFGLGKLLSPTTNMLEHFAPQAGLIPTMAANATDAAGIGAAMGYEGGQGGWTDPSRIHGAEGGAVAGGIFGAAASPATKVAEAFWNATGGRALDAIRPDVDVGAVPPADGEEALPGLTSVPRSAASNAYNLVARALARSRLSPQEAIEAASANPNLMLADASVPMQDFARTVAATPGEGGQLASDALNLRQSGRWGEVPSASQRIADTLTSALGVSGPSADARIAELDAQARSEAAPLYARAYGADPVPVENLSQFSGSPQFTDAYNKARFISQREFALQPDGSEAIAPLPPKMPDTLDWRTLDLMKRGMNDLYQEGVQSGGLGATTQKAMTGFTGRFTGALRSMNPDYAAALDAYAGPEANAAAIDAGKSYIKDDAAGVTGELAALPPSEQQFYRLGAASAVQTKLGSVPTERNAAQVAGVSTPNALQKYQQLFPDQQSFNDFHNMLQQENLMTQTRNRVLSGSLTDRNLAQQADAGVDPLELGSAAIETAHSPVTGIMKVVGSLMKAGNGQGMTEPVANAAAGILFNPNNAAYPDYLQGLTDAQRRLLLAQAVQSARPVVAAQAGQQVVNWDPMGAFGPQQ